MSLLKKYYLLLIIAIACLIILPFRSGYILLLDYASVPDSLRAKPWHYTEGIMRGVLKLFEFGLGARLTQYVIFLAFLIIAACAMWRIITIQQQSSQTNTTVFSSIFSLLFVLINPFFYARMLDGQYNVFGGWALLFLGLSYLYSYYRQASRKTLIIWSCIAGLAVSLLYHAIFFVGLMSTAILIVDAKWQKRIWRWGVSMLIVIALNLNWILAGMFGNSELGQVVNHFDQQHLSGFATTIGQKGVFFNALSLHGFRGEDQMRFALTTDANTRRYVLFGSIFVLTIIGIISSYNNEKSDRKWTIWLVCVSVLAYFLALGISPGGLIGRGNQQLYDYIPFYIGLREPQKRLGLIVLVYARYAGRGGDYLYKKIIAHDPWFRYIISPLFVIVPLAYTPYMLFAFHGQLKTVHFPTDRYETKNTLYQSLDTNANTGQYDVLALPRHQYMRFSFTDKVIPNVIDSFFGAQSYTRRLHILVGDNMELGSVYSQSSRPASQVIERYVRPNGIWSKTYTIQLAQEFIKDIQTLGIDTILVFNELDGSSNNTYLYNLMRDGLIIKLKENTKTTLRKIKKQ